MRSAIVPVMVLALLAPSALVAPAAVADTPASIVDVTADAGPFTVSRFTGQAASRITVVVDDPSGTIGRHCMDFYYAGIQVRLQRTAGGPATMVDVDVPRVSSVAGHDTYSALWRIASTRNGTWTIVELMWCGQNLEAIDPRRTPGVTRTVTVRGTALPVATVTYVPKALPFPTRRNGAGGRSQRAVLTYRTATGAPIRGAAVLLGTEYACWSSPIPPTPGNAAWPTTTLVTDSAGRVSVLLNDLDPCVSLLGPAASAGFAYTRALVRTDSLARRYYYSTVSAAATSNRVVVGRTLTVNGAVLPRKGTVRLQRLIGRTWRTIGSAAVRASGRFTLTAPVTRKGVGTYRVVAAWPWSPTSFVTYALVPTASRSFRVTGR